MGPTRLQTGKVKKKPNTLHENRDAENANN